MSDCKKSFNFIAASLREIKNSFTWRRKVAKNNFEQKCLKNKSPALPGLYNLKNLSDCRWTVYPK